MEYADITEQIIGCAYRVYNAMGYGFLESAYEKCMLIELSTIGLKVDFQLPLHAMYRGEIVGDFIADIVVEDNIIVELKSVRKLIPVHEAQLVNYLVATGKPLGLLINFGQVRVEVKRKTRTLNI